MGGNFVIMRAMKHFKRIVVLCGAQSYEREVSLESGEAVFQALKKIYPTFLWVLDLNELPRAGLHPDEDLIFPMIHGDFGEDGQLQTLLEKRGFTYIGSGPKASSLCIDKLRSKQFALEHSIPVLPAMELKAKQTLSKKTIEQTLGSTSFVLKPVDKGSSLGVYVCSDFSDLQKNWEQLYEKKKRTENFQYPLERFRWMLERRVKGRELTVGLLHGKALAVGEICPKQGFYDYEHKYTDGTCFYQFPASLPAEATRRLQQIAEKFFQAAGCRDFGRADFMMDADGNFWFLEMNTVPGMTASHSLLPKSAACLGISFEELLKRLVDNACDRFPKR